MARTRRSIPSPHAAKAAALALVVLLAGMVLYSKAPTDVGVGTTRHAAVQRAAAPPAPPAPPWGVLHVAGNQLVDASGAPVRLYGVNRSGTEYACVQGWGIFAGPTGDASVQQLVAAHVHAVRLPLNEDCWLGINGYGQRTYMGAPYRSAVADYVHRLVAHHIYAILDLHWVAAGTTTAFPSQRMPDADHSTAFWQDVAATFANRPGVLFDLYNEPHDVDWSCWKSGGCTDQAGYAVAGMQQLLDAVRGAGAHNVALVEGLAWANDVTGLLANWPADPEHNLATSMHMYAPNSCNDVACWDKQVAPVAARVPLIIGEYCACDAPENERLDTPFGDAVVQWADAHGLGYLAWTWDVGFGVTSLLAAPDATQLTPYGQWLAQQYATLDGAPFHICQHHPHGSNVLGTQYSPTLNGQPLSVMCIGPSPGES